MASYTDNDPKGWCGDPRRGAAMGRSSVVEIDNIEEVEITVCEVEIDEGGYDPNGTYFGCGNPIFWFATEDGTLDYVKRALDQGDALDDVRERYPNARIKVGGMICWKRPVCVECGHVCEFYGCEHCGHNPMDNLATVCIHCQEVGQ